jgi:hypothetical protein
METRIHSAVENDCIHNAAEVLIRAKLKMTEKIALSAPLKQSSVFIIHIHVYATLVTKTKMAKSWDLLRKRSYSD